MTRPHSHEIEPEWYEYLLFGSKACTLCTREFPANTDFFGRSATKPDGMLDVCRSCRNARDRRRREHGAAIALKAVSL